MKGNSGNTHRLFSNQICVTHFQQTLETDGRWQDTFAWDSQVVIARKMGVAQNRVPRLLPTVKIAAPVGADSSKRRCCWRHGCKTQAKRLLGKEAGFWPSLVLVVHSVGGRGVDLSERPPPRLWAACTALCTPGQCLQHPAAEFEYCACARPPQPQGLLNIPTKIRMARLASEGHIIRVSSKVNEAFSFRSFSGTRKKNRFRIYS